ncbi:unnamed protein product [Alopecurus aequalis]
MVRLRSQRDTDQAGFEFYRFMSYGISWDKLVLPDKFASELSGRELREVKMRVAGGGGRRVWDVEVDVSEYGDMCLGRGWREFAGANGLELGQLLLMRRRRKRRRRRRMTRKRTRTTRKRKRRRRLEDDDDGAEGNSLPPAPAPARRSSGRSSRGGMAAVGADTPFSVMLRKCHFGEKHRQYLQVPPWFKEAHGYTERIKVVVLQMRGESWTVSLKHSKQSRGGARTAFRYGWHHFCVDNGLGLGDTCFFQAVGEGSAHRGEGHVLRVEVRKPDGTVVQ